MYHYLTTCDKYSACRKVSYRRFVLPELCTSGKGYLFYEIPDAISGRKVFVTNEEGVFASIPKVDEPEVLTSEEHVVIQDDGDAIVEITFRVPRNLSVKMREAFKNAPADEREKLIYSSEAELSSGGKVLQREWRNLDTPHANITVQLKYENSHLVQRVGNMMMFGLPQRQRETLFTTPKRKYPIVFTTADSIIEKYSVTYSIPNEYEIVNLPKDVHLNYDFAEFERSYRVEGNSILGKETSAYKESRTPAAEYQKVRTFLDDITRLTNDMIMIRKKG